MKKVGKRVWGELMPMRKGRRIGKKFQNKMTAPGRHNGESMPGTFALARRKGARLGEGNGGAVVFKN